MNEWHPGSASAWGRAGEYISGYLWFSALAGRVGAGSEHMTLAKDTQVLALGAKPHHRLVRVPGAKGRAVYRLCCDHTPFLLHPHHAVASCVCEMT